MNALVSNLNVDVADPDAFMRHLGEHLDEDHPPAIGPDGDREMTIYGSLTRFRFVENRLAVRVEGQEEGSHGVAKGVVAWYVQHILGDDCPPLVWTGHGADTKVLAHFRELRVVSAHDVTPHMRRVRLAGESLHRFATGGLHIRLLFPPEGRVPVWPHAGPAALPVFPEGEDELKTRVYTIRRIDADAGHLDVDVAMHEPPGVGCRWASDATPGDPVGMLGPGGGDVRPADWHVLLGDETALPAIGRILEEMPATARGTAFVEIDGPAEEQKLAHPAGVEIRWLHRNGRPAGTTSLLEDAARSMQWPQDAEPFVWSGTEFAAFKAIRRICRKERGLKKAQHLVVAYWRLGQRQDDAPTPDED